MPTWIWQLNFWFWIRLLGYEARRGRQWEEDRSPEILKQKVEGEAKKIELRKKLAVWMENKKILTKGEEYLNTKNLLSKASLEKSRR